MKRKRGKAASWGYNDKASREQMRRYSRKKDHEKDKRKFEKSAFAEDHPQVCAICLDNVKTHLVSDCGNAELPLHRYHGFCEQCSADIIATGRCALCRGAVQNAWYVGAAFFVGV
jgi:hypothetical protein